MGLDTVELVMTIEDEFGISIPDVDLEALETVGGVYEYLRRRLAEERGQRCVTQATFYRLRSAMTTRFGLLRQSVRPGTRLDELLPAEAWRSHWKELSAAAALQLPRILTSGHQRATEWTGCTFIVAAVAIPALLGYSVGVAIVVASVVTLGVSVLTRWARPGLEILVSTSLRDFVQTVVVLNKLSAGSPEWTDERIWLTLRHIVVQQLGVPPEQVTADAHFVRDLGAD